MVTDLRSVAQVASELGVTPERVRQLIQTGALPAVRVGDRWVIDDGMPVRRQEGRPWSEAAAWGLLWMAAGRPAPWLSVKQRQRVRMRMVEGVPAHVDRLSARAKQLWFRAHPSALPRLVSDCRLVDSGLSVAGVVGADLVVADRVEGYVRSSDLISLIAEYGLEPVAPGQGNLVLRSVSEVWPFVDGEGVAPALVVALDLMDSPDARTSRAGRGLLKRALRKEAE
jgi:excisionase family DNA binding protein